MSKIKEKLYDWKDRLKDRHMLSLVVSMFAIIVILGMFIYKRERDFRREVENRYNMAFFELVDYVQNVETYLAKSLISSTPEHGAETLTNVWREANLAQTYLAMLPMESNELANTSKFLNQVSDYSFSLSRKNINNEYLTDEDFSNLKELHNYSLNLEGTLNQLSSDMNDGRISWGELTKKGSPVFATQVSNISKDTFKNLDDNFHEYSGLIYDGAFSEHMTSFEKRGLTGDNIDEKKAEEIAKTLVDQNKISSINFNGLSQNTDMPCFDFTIILKDEESKDINANVSISKKGGHIVFLNYNRNTSIEIISSEKAVEIGKDFLLKHGFDSMKETYYLKEQGILTINYAFMQKYNDEDVIMYPDLIKVKVALDNGEVVGIETTGYLNSHTLRNIPDIKISKEEAKKYLNKNLNIMSEGLAYIPTEFMTEIFVWEFKGKVDDTEFLVYINALNRKRRRYISY